MRGARSLLLLPLALAAAGCSRNSQTYMVYDPNTGQQYVTTALPQAAYPQQSQGFELYGQANSASYAQAGVAQQSYAQTTPKASTEISQNDIPNRGLFTARRSSSYVAPPAQQPY